MHYFCSGKVCFTGCIFSNEEESYCVSVRHLRIGYRRFTMMGILPYVAADLNISIPVAGHFISAYALGVCAGAPMLILARKRPLKHYSAGIDGFDAGRKSGGWWLPIIGRCWRRVSFRACRMGHTSELLPLWRVSWLTRVEVPKPYPL